MPRFLSLVIDCINNLYCSAVSKNHNCIELVKSLIAKIVRCTLGYVWVSNTLGYVCYKLIPSWNFFILCTKITVVEFCHCGCLTNVTLETVDINDSLCFVPYLLDYRCIILCVCCVNILCTVIKNDYEVVVTFCLECYDSACSCIKYICECLCFKCPAPEIVKPAVRYVLLSYVTKVELCNRCAVVVYLNLIVTEFFNCRNCRCICAVIVEVIEDFWVRIIFSRGTCSYCFYNKSVPAGLCEVIYLTVLWCKVCNVVCSANQSEIFIKPLIKIKFFYIFFS